MYEALDSYPDFYLAFLPLGLSQPVSLLIKIITFTIISYLPIGGGLSYIVGLLASLAAREVIVSTLAQIYAAGEGESSLRSAIQNDVDPGTGSPVYTPATVAALLVFFVFALQCLSTIAVMRRETNSWRWPAFAFSYLLVAAYTASFATHRIGSAVTGAG